MAGIFNDPYLDYEVKPWEGGIMGFLKSQLRPPQNLPPVRQTMQEMSTQNTGQKFNDQMGQMHPMDKAALATSTIPIAGDIIGLAADARMFAQEPEQRNAMNYGLSALGALPFVPNLGIIKGMDFPNQVKSMKGEPIRKVNEARESISSNPYRAYHSTNADFNEFDPDKGYGGQMWFTSKKELAEQGYDGAQGGRLVEADLDIRNPAGRAEYEKYSTDELLGMGYDGIKLEEGGETVSVALFPEQVRIESNSIVDPNKGILGDSVKSVDDLSDSIEKKYNLKSFSAYESGEDIKLSSIIVPKDARKQGVGSKAVQDLIDYADTQGKRVTLTPAIKDDFQGTTSSARLKKFYKKFGFVENKGRNKDFKISDSMYREPK